MCSSDLIRRKNLLREGRPQATGTLMRDAALDKVLERLAQRMNWDDKEKPFDKGGGTIKRGRGMAIGFKASISPTTSMGCSAMMRRRISGLLSFDSCSISAKRGDHRGDTQLHQRTCSTNCC